MFNLDAIAASTVSHDPFDYFMVPDVLSGSDLADVAAKHQPVCQLHAKRHRHRRHALRLLGHRDRLLRHLHAHGEFDGGRQRVGIHREAVILRGNFAFACEEIFYRMIDPSVSMVHFESRNAIG
mgnify:CR=1 FL=1